MKKHPDNETYTPVARQPKGTGPGSAGQSGDTQGLTDIEDAENESVEELVEEGQYFEAEVVSGVENAEDADGGGKGKPQVHTKEVPEDDVPPEYRNDDIPPERT